MNSRHFLKKLAKTVVILTIVILTCSLFTPKPGIIKAVDAYWFAQTQRGVSASTSWANWDETTEAGWGDQANNFIILMENASAGGNETGIGGGLSGADLVGTQGGNLVGATGSPPTRPYDGTDDRMAWTSPAAQSVIAASSSFTIIQKWNAYADVTSNIPFVIGSGGADEFYAYVNAAGKLELYLKDSIVNYTPYGTATTNSVPTTGDLYICYWSDGTYMRWGFTTTKPTKWSDFAAGNRVSITFTVAFTPGFTNPHLAGYTSNWPTGKLYYFIASKKCLIDNAL